MRIRLGVLGECGVLGVRGVWVTASDPGFAGGGVDVGGVVGVGVGGATIAALSAAAAAVTVSFLPVPSSAVTVSSVASAATLTAGAAVLCVWASTRSLAELTASSSPPGKRRLRRGAIHIWSAGSGGWAVSEHPAVGGSRPVCAPSVGERLLWLGETWRVLSACAEAVETTAVVACSES